MLVWMKTPCMCLGITVDSAMDAASAKLINLETERKMSEDKSKEVKEELTFTFEEDGKEYKVDDLNDENKLLYNKVVLLNNQRRDALNQIGNLNFEVEKLELLSQHYSNLLKDAVEGGEDTVEVVQ